MKEKENLRVKKKRSNELSLHDLVIALCEKRNVYFHGHTLRLVELIGNGDSCELCDMDCLCDKEMVELCCACETLIKEPCCLKLVNSRPL